MKKPKLPEMDVAQSELCAKALMIAMLATNAEEMTIRLDNFNKDGYIFGDFEVTVKKV